MAIGLALILHQLPPECGVERGQPWRTVRLHRCQFTGRQLDKDRLFGRGHHQGLWPAIAVAGQSDEATGAEHEDLFGHGPARDGRTHRTTQDKVQAVLAVPGHRHRCATRCFEQRSQGCEFFEPFQAHDAAGQGLGIAPCRARRRTGVELPQGVGIEVPLADDPLQGGAGARCYKPAQGMAELQRPCRPIGKKRAKAPPGNGKAVGVLHRANAGRAWTVIQQRKFTYDLAGAYLRYDGIFIARDARGDLKQACLDKVESIGMITLPEQHVPGSGGERQGVAQQCRPSFAIEPGKLRRCLRSLSH